ncbi:hypothetical protein N7492_009554 [Penicillium capsulatum]|uniref:Thiol methyltransferase n=1 Tax=Penicillium capsulatum TaxID=69766 RepID=A0A9W9HSQ3_9EURO|nr:hypothetical protein N7492_009554 [Penicillium capsulatum]
MTQPKGRLLSAFQDRAGLTQDRPIQDHGSGWSHLWDSGESALWDRGEASPALVDAVEQEQELLGPFTADGRRKKALVPGCGRGYDVVMLALHGFDAYGLEISGTAVQEAELYASSEMKTPSSYHYGTKKTQYGSPGSVTFIQGDFFSTNWENKGGINAATTFDVVYDYTVRIDLCLPHGSEMLMIE